MNMAKEIYSSSVAFLKAIQYGFESSTGVGGGFRPLPIFTVTLVPASIAQRLI